MVALENRFLKTRNGDIYSSTVCDYNFWRRYLQVFDEVVVFARVAKIPQTELDKPKAGGPGVSFIELPTFIGPWQYLKKYLLLNSIAKKAVSEVDTYILRIPGSVATLIWCHLESRRLPYGVEVVGSVKDSLSSGAVKSFVRPIAQMLLAKRQKQQCQQAVAAAYVSEAYLQKEYPPGRWSTHYSSIDLSEDAIVDVSALKERFVRLHKAVKSKEPFKICHIGSMSALYKAQDVLMKSVALCHKNGHNASLTFLGDGKYQDFYIKKAREFNVSGIVEFAGRVPPGKPVREYLDRSDLFVLPSLTEGLPRSLIEAMARGLPCIGSNVGGIPELLQDEDMVEPKSAEKLAEKIMSVMQNQKKLEEMARRNLKKAEEYCLTKLNKRRVEFYNKVMKATETCHANRSA